jgi:hypothetical protein
MLSQATLLYRLKYKPLKHRLNNFKPNVTLPKPLGIQKRRSLIIYNIKRH